MTQAERIAIRQGGPTTTLAVGADPYPPASAANKAQLSGAGWVRMILRLKQVRDL
jgi:hypothetical protein